MSYKSAVVVASRGSDYISVTTFSWLYVATSLAPSSCLVMFSRPEAPLAVAWPPRDKEKQKWRGVVVV